MAIPNVEKTRQVAPLENEALLSPVVKLLLPSLTEHQHRGFKKQSSIVYSSAENTRKHTNLYTSIGRRVAHKHLRWPVINIHILRFGKKELWSISKFVRLARKCLRLSSVFSCLKHCDIEGFADIV